MATTIQNLIQNAAPGSTVTVPSGTYDVSGLTLPGNITLQAGGDVTLTGSMTVSGPQTVVSGFTFSGGTVDISNSTGVTIKNSVFNGGHKSIDFSGARDALITNNEFHDVTGNVVTGWGLDQSTISGNKFFDCWQPVNLSFNNNKSQGRDITVADNYFTGTQRMSIEAGPTGAYTSNMVVKDNWSENMSNAGKQDGWHTGVAYSVVPTYGVNTRIEGNYASGQGEGVGIELNGSGEVSGNYVEDFWYGAIVYENGFNVHDNAFVNTPIETVLNYADKSGTVQNNQTTAAGFDMPEKPGTAPDSSPAAPPVTANPAPSDPAPSDPAPLDPAPSDPAPSNPAPSNPAPSTGGSGSPVVAVDDDFWKIGVNDTMWQNARYLTWNDKGADGGLKVTEVASKSAAGGSISFTSDGTIKYKPAANWSGKDHVQYTVQDADGSTDTGEFYIQVGNGTSTPPATAEPAPSEPAPSTGGSGAPVATVDDHWSLKAGGQHWFNTRYVLQNDSAPDGGLKIKGIGTTTAKGGTVSWNADTGTAIYKPKAGFTGKDYVEYTAIDADGSTDSGQVHFDVLIA